MKTRFAQILLIGLFYDGLFYDVAGKQVDYTHWKIWIRNIFLPYIYICKNKNKTSHKETPLKQYRCCEHSNHQRK